MTDIVERLRTYDPLSVFAYSGEAADTIESLRARVAELDLLLGAADEDNKALSFNSQGMLKKLRARVAELESALEVAYAAEAVNEVIAALKAGQEPVAIYCGVIDGHHTILPKYELMLDKHQPLYTKAPTIGQGEPIGVAIQGVHKDNTLSIFNKVDVPVGTKLFTKAPTVPEAVMTAIGTILNEVMEQAVANGANSVSMPDEYVEVAAWLCGIPPQVPTIPKGWQPIETAPKDGTRVLTVVRGFVVCIGWWFSDAGKWMTTDAEDYADDGAWEYQVSNSVYLPTHWMPLPAGPKP